METQKVVGQLMSSSMQPVEEDDRYGDFLTQVSTHFRETTKTARALFATDAEGLWDAYLDAAPPGTRISRTCNTCRHFIERFGGLVTIDERGNTRSALWDLASPPPAYVDAVRALNRIVSRASVTGVFFSSDAMWGTPVTGPWTHVAVTPPTSMIWSSLLATAGQAAAEKKSEFEMLQRGLADFPVDVAREALALLTSGGLYRSEKCEGVAKWIVDLHERRAAAHGRQRENVTWLAVAGAPAGFCHIRSGMIGTLLEDIQAKLPFEAVKSRFDAKMNPLQYQRPTAAPTAGNIAQAEKIVATLRSAGALERRFAKLADVQPLWLPPVPKEAPKPEGVFGHLRASTASDPIVSAAPPAVMTWVKFAASVLPTAERIDVLIPLQASPFTAMVTAKHADAPPIVQWDSVEKRNPVTWYTCLQGSLSTQWNVRAGEYHPLTAIVLQPSMWDAGRSFDHHGKAAMLVLKGARDTAYRVGAGLFPELLKSDYHSIRSTLEAHFRASVVEGRDEAEVCGLLVRSGARSDFTLRVTSKGVRSTYRIDRWD